MKIHIHPSVVSLCECTLIECTECLSVLRIRRDVIGRISHYFVSMGGCNEQKV